MVFSTYLLADCPVEGYDNFECVRYHLINNRPPDAEKTVYSPLSYRRLMEYIDEFEFRNDSYQDEQLFDIAYQYNSTIIYKPSRTKLIEYILYTLNFLWINRYPMNENGHIMGDDKKMLYDKIINPLERWRAQQPEAIMNFWYDSKMLPEKALANTQKEMQHIKNMQFRDIRDIEYVKENPVIFDSIIPVYIRADLAKALIGDHELKNGRKYAVNIDSDIVAFTDEQLFDRKTIKELCELGFVFGAPLNVG